MALVSCAASRSTDGVSHRSAHRWVGATSDPRPGFGDLSQRKHSEAARSGAYVVSSLTWGVLILQLCLAMALFLPRAHRVLLFPVGILFHLGNVTFFGLMSFFWAMAAALVLYLLPTDALASRAFDGGVRALRQALRHRYRPQIRHL